MIPQEYFKKCSQSWLILEKQGHIGIADSMPKVEQTFGLSMNYSKLSPVLIPQSQTSPAHTFLMKLSIKQTNSSQESKHILGRTLLFLYPFLCFLYKPLAQRYYFWKHFVMEDFTWVPFSIIIIILVINNNDLYSSLRRHCYLETTNAKPDLILKSANVMGEEKARGEIKTDSSVWRTHLPSGTKKQVTWRKDSAKMEPKGKRFFHEVTAGDAGCRNSLSLAKAGVPWGMTCQRASRAPKQFYKQERMWPLQECREPNRGGIASHLHPYRTDEGIGTCGSTGPCDNITKCHPATLPCGSAGAGKWSQGPRCQAVYRHGWLIQPFGHLVKDPNCWAPSKSGGQGGSRNLCLNNKTSQGNNHRHERVLRMTDSSECHRGWVNHSLT